MTTHNVVTELQRLSLSRPSPNASCDALVGWYERKATVLDHLRNAALATVAREHAARLRAAAGLPVAD